MISQIRLRLFAGLALLATAIAFGRSDAFRSAAPETPLPRQQTVLPTRPIDLPEPAPLTIDPPRMKSKELPALTPEEFAARLSDPRAQQGFDRERARRYGTTRKPPALPPTSEVLLVLNEGADAQDVARDHGLRVRHPIGHDRRIWVFAAGTPHAAQKARADAAVDPRVAGAFLNRRVVKVHMAFVPDDPYFPNNAPGAPGFPGQWHLGNGGPIATHANLGPAWNRNLTGQGVLLSIVDDGLETTHPDLAANFVLADSLNHQTFTTNIDPNPLYDGNWDEARHGTCVGGVAAAVGGNTIGVTGAAPNAGLAAQVIDFHTLTDGTLMSAVLYHSSGSNRNIKVKNHSYGAQDTFVDDQLESDAVSSSTAVGTIHVFAGGNSRPFWDEDSNKQQPQNNPDVISVAAIASDGIYSGYSSFGANIFVCAPSSHSGLPGITTTDRQGAHGYCPNDTLPIPPTPPGPQPGDLDSFPDQNYTSRFGGTSSASPLVAGIMALGAQQNPNLTTRLAQHALVRSSKLCDPNDGTVPGGGNGSSGSAWKTNAAGFKFNQNYGFGLIDADKFTQQLTLYSGVTPVVTETTGVISVAQPIPDFPDPGGPAGVTQTFTLNSTTPLESLQIRLNLTHTWRGDLEATLTHAGTVCRIFCRAPGDSGTLPDPNWVHLSQWTFVTHAFWGENPSGLWSLNIKDLAAADTGTWNTFEVIARMGRPTLAGTVTDGFSGGDLTTQTSATTMGAHWSFANDPTIPIASYEWAIGSFPGFANIMPFTNVGTATAASTDQANVTLALQTGRTYYVTVRAIDNTGCVSEVSSNGVQMTGAAGTPAAPGEFHALAQPGSAILQWTPSPSPEVTFYRLWHKVSSASWQSATLVDNLVGTTTTVNSLTNGLTYDFLLRAVTASGSESPGLTDSAAPGNLITLNGGGNYGSIQAALNAATNGSTVRVLAGTYVENIIMPPGVTLIGASPKNTILTSPSGSADVITAGGVYPGNPQAIVSNVGITGGRVGIVAGTSDLLVVNVVVHHMNSHAITAAFGSHLLVVNCTLAHNGGDGIVSFAGTLVRNVVAASNAGFGINVPAVSSQVSYCDAYGNPSSDYTAGIANGSTFSVPVTFTNEPANDYTELPGAVTIDNGDPNDPYALEPSYNGGRVNVGAFGNTKWAARSPLPPPPAGGGGGGGCGLTGLEPFLLLAALGALRRNRS